MRRVECVLGVVVCGAIAVFAPAARGAHLSPLAPHVTAFSSDGVRYVAWQVSEETPITVLDTASGHRGSLIVPADCALDGRQEAGGGEAAAAGGRFLLNCGRPGAHPEQDLLDAHTDAVALLPTLLGTVRWSHLGTHYAEGTAPSDRCTHTQQEEQNEALCVALYELTSGQISYRSASVPANLDAAGAPAICGALRAKLAHARGVGLGSSYGYADGVFAVAAKRGTVHMDRCHGRTRTIADPHGEPVNFDPRGGLLTWDTGHEATDSEPSQRVVSRGELLSFGLSNSQRHSWTLPRLTITGSYFSHGVFGYSTHTANMVFWIASRSVVGGLGPGIVGSSSIYAARLPRAASRTW
jgi:hypothetical protein